MTNEAAKMTGTLISGKFFATTEDFIVSGTAEGIETESDIEVDYSSIEIDFFQILSTGVEMDGDEIGSGTRSRIIAKLKDANAVELVETERIEDDYDF